jgi:hypothetical protein
MQRREECKLVNIIFFAPNTTAVSNNGAYGANVVDEHVRAALRDQLAAHIL